MSDRERPSWVPAPLPQPVPHAWALLECGHKRVSPLRLPTENIHRDALFCLHCLRHNDVVDRWTDR